MTRTTERDLDEAAASWIRAAERGELVEKRARGGPPAYSTGGWNSGPAFTDWNRTRRAPTPFDLVEAWRQLTFGCSVLNANAVSRQTLRLYVSTAMGQHRPKSYLRGRPVTRASQVYLRSQPEYGRHVKGADEIDEVTEHPLLSLIGEVNPDWDHSRLIRYTSLCLDIIGRAHWLPGDEQGNPMRGRVLAPYLWPLLAQYVLPYRETEGSLVSHYSYFSREYEPSDLMNFRFDSLRDPYALGQSPTQAAFAFVGLSDSYAALMENLLTQSVRPSVIVTNTDPDEPFGEAERRRLQREINYQLSAGGVGKAWVVDGSIDVKSLNVPPVSLAENAISETAIQYVSFIFGVPLSFLRNEDSNRAIAEAGHYQHAKLGVEPRCVNIASTLTKWTHAEGRRRGQDWSRLLWAFDNPVKDDEEREAQVFDLRLRSGATTINEYRTHLGYSPVPWGDEPWMAGSLVQPSQAAEDRRRSQSSRDDDDDPDADPAGSNSADDVDETEETADEPTAKLLNGRRNGFDNSVEAANSSEPTNISGRWWDWDDSGKWRPSCSWYRRKGKRRAKPTGGRRRPPSSGGRGGKKPKPASHAVSPAPGSDDVIEIPPAGGHGNRYHYRQGTRFAPAPGGQSPAATRQNKPKKRTSRVGKSEHTYASRQERRIATILGGEWLKDHEPMDVLVQKRRLHGVEVKTLMKGLKNGVKMHSYALERKVDWQRAQQGRIVHTIVIDHRDRYKGGRYSDRASGSEMYYKRGAGSYNLSQMHRVGSDSELRALVMMPNNKLPVKARGALPSGAALANLRKQAVEDRAKHDNRGKRYRQKQRDLANQTGG